jgi:peptidoglycan hydrolase-like protein with peptidoglycan-binding domain
MGERPKNGRTAKSFDLLDNPFSVLGIEPTAALEKIADAFDDAIADQAASEAELSAAREALVNPRQRTSAELSFLLDTPPREVAAIYAALKQNSSLADLVRIADRLAPLSQANLLTHIAAQRPSTADLLFALVDAHARIDPKTVHAKLESTRKAAGITVPSIDSVRDELHLLLSSHAKAAISGFPSSKAAAYPVEECTKRVLVTADSDRIDALDGLVRAFAQAIAPDLRQLEEQIRSAGETLRGCPNDVGLIDPIAGSLRDWIKLARPIVELDAHKGRDEERARLLFNEVRGLAIDLFNKHDSFHAALSISNIAAEVFHLLPRALEQLKEDLAILEERSAEAFVVPLRKWIDELSKWTIVKDLEIGGFGHSSVRQAKELWIRFLSAAKETQQTKAAELPWVFLRNLAIDINNEESSPLAAKAILEGLIRCAHDIPLSEAVLEKINEDLRDVRRNLREKEMIEDIQANRITPALEGIYELLKLTKSSDDRVALTRLKDQLERRRTGRYLKWGAFAVVGAIVLYASISGNQSPRTNYSNDRPPTRPPANYSSRADYPAPNPPSQAFEPAVETKPPLGSASVFSQANIRYCRYQKERFRAIEKDLRNNEEIGAFNALVDDYNSRCEKFQYRERDLQIVTEEASRKSEALAAEGRNILMGWRVRPSIQLPPLTSVAPSFPAVIPQPPAISATQPPAAILDSSGANTPNDPVIDLLQLETAIRAQKRLGELGFFRGPNNGAWGPQSRNSLRSFKVENGLTSDDVFDANTMSRLYSADAKRSVPSIKLPAPNAALETSYPPPVGTTLNPLNRLDATKIHTKLRELGFYRANSNVLWSAASRDSLKEFKNRNDLEPNDVWDAATEQRLMSATPALTPEDVQAGFAAATSGTWSIDLRACPGGVGGSDALALTITPKRAETDGARCEFGNISGLGTSWKTLGVCTVNGETRKANIALVRTGEVLVWSSESGTTKYLRCPN